MNKKNSNKGKGDKGLGGNKIQRGDNRSKAIDEGLRLNKVTKLTVAQG